MVESDAAAVVPNTGPGKAGKRAPERPMAPTNALNTPLVLGPKPPGTGPAEPQIGAHGARYHIGWPCFDMATNPRTRNTKDVESCSS